jgi:hypothetical protein
MRDSAQQTLFGPWEEEMNQVVWKESPEDRRYYVGGSDARISMGNGIATEDLNRRWYEAIAGGTPSGWYIATFCYAIAVISLGWFPWNFLLVGLLFLIRNKPLRERAPLRSGPDDGHVVLNSMKTTFAVSRSCR